MTCGCCTCHDGPTECIACLVGCPHTWTVPTCAECGQPIERRTFGAAKRGNEGTWRHSGRGLFTHPGVPAGDV